MNCREFYIFIWISILVSHLTFCPAYAQLSSPIVKENKAINNNVISGNQIICGITTHATPFPQTGSLPISNGNAITYLWEETDNIANPLSWTSGANTNNLQNYQPAMINKKTWYRRIVFSGFDKDTSNIDTVKFLHNFAPITNNLITPNNQIVNSGTIPNQFNGNTPSGGNGSPFYYCWFKSQNGSTFIPMWVATEGSNTSKDLIFGEVADSSFYYNRFVYLILPTTEIACLTHSNSVQVILSDSNIIYISDTLICSGTSPDIITGSTSINFTYQWQVKISSWVDIAGATSSNFQPGVLTATKNYRRIVTTNKGNTIPSNVITIHVLPNISNNTIYTTNDDTTSISVCKGLKVEIGSGSHQPSGSLAFTYNWQQSTDNINWSSALNNSSLNFVTPAIIDTMYFRRLVTSSTACESFSNVITVYPIILNINAGNDTTICGNTISHMNATHYSSGTEWWTYPSWITLENDSSYNTFVNSSSYMMLSQLYWHLQIGNCHDSARVTITFFSPIVPPYAGNDITLLNTDSTKLNATSPTNGTGNWSVISGGGNFDYTSDSKTWVHNISSGENIYRWTVTNGPCVPLYDDVKVITSSLNIPEGFSPNGDNVNDFFEISGIDNLNKSELIIFNRWGNEVYHKLNYDNSWNGKNINGKPLAEDTYFYVFILNEKETKKGYLILKR